MMVGRNRTVVDGEPDGRRQRGEGVEVDTRRGSGSVMAMVALR